MLMQNMLLILCIIAVATYVVAWIEIYDVEKPRLSALSPLM